MQNGENYWMQTAAGRQREVRALNRYHGIKFMALNSERVSMIKTTFMLGFALVFATPYLAAQNAAGDNPFSDINELEQLLTKDCRFKKSMLWDRGAASGGFRQAVGK